jgi:hypothetical protein
MSHPNFTQNLLDAINIANRTEGEILEKVKVIHNRGANSKSTEINSVLIAADRLGFSSIVQYLKGNFLAFKNVNIPDDISNLFRAVTLAFLFPIRHDSAEFEEHFKKLFTSNCLGKIFHF